MEYVSNVQNCFVLLASGQAIAFLLFDTKEQ